MAAPSYKSVLREYGYIAGLRTSEVFKLVDRHMYGEAKDHCRLPFMGLILMMELYYRAHGKERFVPATIWTLVYGNYDAPAGLMSPSEAFPHLRCWVWE
jgi:hypothetical protein